MGKGWHYNQSAWILSLASRESYVRTCQIYRRIVYGNEEYIAMIINYS